MKPIVILGIFVADTTYRASRQPKLGETILGEGFALGPGGKGSNQAVAAGRALRGTGGEVQFITRLGDDDFAKIARGVWAEAGVTPEVTVDPESYTGAAFIFIEAASGNNAIIVSPGAAARIGPADLQARKDLIAGAAVFVTQLEQPLEAAREGLAIARAAGVPTILNPAPAVALDDGILALCDYLTPNETETEILTGMKVTTLDEAKAAAEALLERGVGAVVMTLGEKGVLYHSQGQTLHLPAVAPGPVVETTGAGDAFHGGFVAALAEGKGIEEALRFGSATAGISVTRAGAAASMPARDEILALLAR